MFVRCLAFSSCVLASSSASSQPSPSTTDAPAPAQVSQSRDQGQDQNRDQSQDQRQNQTEAQPPAFPQPPPAPAATQEEQLPAAKDALAAPTGEISLDEWNRDDWLLLRSSVSLLEVNGYFRLRGDLLRKMDFDNGSGWERTTNPTDTAGTEPRYSQAAAGQANYNMTNMRLRLEPQVNATDNIQVVTTVDILDNLLLGSTPDSLPPASGSSPTDATSRTQEAPQKGVNALNDSFVVKRAYARLTALNEQLELRFGRMPNHWGLGMMTNDGDALDADYGDVADRVALTFRAANHLFSPMYDWIATGPQVQPFGRTGGQPIDAYDKDDVVQYSLRVLRLDHPEDVQDRVRQGSAVFNYGLWASIRRQKRGLRPEYYAQGYDPAAPITSDDLQDRNTSIYTLDGFSQLHWGPIELGVELAGIGGSFQDRLFATDDGRLQRTTLYKLGGALEGKWQMPDQRPGSAVTLMAGAASGDSAPGYGAMDRADTQRGELGTRRDRALENFQFSPDYHVDMLMFRRIIGTVTDAWYARPGVTYLFDDKFAGKLGVIYSQAMFKRSTPGNSRLMGLEFDGELSYGLEGRRQALGPFAASLAGGIAIPFGAFDNPNLPRTERGGSFAWSLQARLYVTF